MPGRFSRRAIRGRPAGVCVGGQQIQALDQRHARGARPRAFDPVHQLYDTLDLSDLVKPGTNVIAAEVIYWGQGEPSRGGPIFQVSARPAFVFESPEVKSDKSWKALISEAHETPDWGMMFKGSGYYAGNWMERSTGASFLKPGSWPPSTTGRGPPPARSPAPRSGARATRARPGSSCPGRFWRWRSGPEWLLLRFNRAKSLDTREAPPYKFDVAPAPGKPSLPHTIPADGKIHYLVFDAGRLVTAFPRLEMEGGEGASVEIMYCEAPSLKFKKGRRDALEEKRVEGCNDSYVARAGAQAFEPFFHRTFWFVRVAVKTPTPMVVRGLSYRWTSYGSRSAGQFECSDAVLNKIWQVGWYTARLCAHESYEDCPYYEQLQYAGDTRIQALLTYYASGDSRLPAQAIRHLGASRLPEGLTYSRYPSHLYQVIPGFSLFWVLMLDDYYMHTGDASLCARTPPGFTRCCGFSRRTARPRASWPMCLTGTTTTGRSGRGHASRVQDQLHLDHAPLQRRPGRRGADFSRRWAIRPRRGGFASGRWKRPGRSTRGRGWRKRGCTRTGSVSTA